MKCNHCGLELTDLTLPCPNCGTYPTENAPRNQKEPVTKNKIARIVLSTIILLVIAGVMLHRCSTDWNREEAYYYAQDVISDQLLSPSSAVFPEYDSSFVSHTSETVKLDGEEYDIYTVTAYVDSQNVFGVLIRSEYQVAIGLSKHSDMYYYEIVYFD